jgi:NADPH:quinone reductase-like Zn-dependent oxidoreductase
MMRALVLHEFGTTPTVEEIDLPEPAEGEVRVRVHAASVNGFDPGEINGWFTGYFEHRFPLVIGKDFSGTVDAVGPGVEGYAEGDRVFGVLTKPWLGDGTMGEYATIATGVGLAPLPDGIDFDEGGALGLAGTTALACLAASEPGPSRTVLVVGATGGVGTQLVQLAAAAGVHVIATARTDEGRELMTALGAAEVVDRDSDIAAAVRAAHPEGVDVAVHLAGDPTVPLAALRDQGTFVSPIVMSPDQLPPTSATHVPIMANPTREVLGQLAGNQASGRTRVVVQRRYPLEDASSALRDFAAGTLGKLVITVP